MPPQRQVSPRQVSPERKTVYYVGRVVGGLGFLCFLSVFVSLALHFGDFTDFAERGRSMAARAVIGMLMLIGGGMLSRVGSMGMAGSGLKLDPEAARREVEPWARMAGGVVKDTLDEAGIKPGGPASGEGLPFDERLRRLAKLRTDGLLTEQEYQETKKKILESA